MLVCVLYPTGGLDTAEPWQGTWSGGVFVECVGKQENDEPKTPTTAARPAAQAQQPPRQPQQQPQQQQQPSPNDSQGQNGCIDLTHEDFDSLAPKALTKTEMLEIKLKLFPISYAPSRYLQDTEPLIGF